MAGALDPLLATLANFTTPQVVLSDGAMFVSIHTFQLTITLQFALLDNHHRNPLFNGRTHNVTAYLITPAFHTPSLIYTHFSRTHTFSLSLSLFLSLFLFLILRECVNILALSLSLSLSLSLFNLARM